MRIVYLAAGAAGMYCGSCLHDNGLAKALHDQGEEILLVPTYTPIRTDEVDQSEEKLFFGGINVFLQQQFAIFRHTPWWLDRLFNRRGLVAWASRSGSRVAPAQLGPLTVSMLRGELGHQSKELEKLVVWLKNEIQPDLVHLSNSMLIGLARRLNQDVGVPVVCSLSGEDIFLEKLQPPHYEQARELLVERAADVAAFVAFNSYFRDFMADYLRVPTTRMEVIPHGLNLEGHAQRAAPTEGAPLRIGYLARICPDKGLHLLAEAFTQLAQDPQLPTLELHVAGYLAAADQSYVAHCRKLVAAANLQGQFHYHGEVDRPGKLRFLQSLHVLSVPTVYRESKGLPVLEAWANGVPVVLPAHGTFPEVVDGSGGGLLCEPDNAASLAAGLRELLVDPARAAELGKAGWQAVQDRYHDRRMAELHCQLYRRLLDQRNAATS